MCKKNNEKFEWYIKNLVNPGRVALLANELNTLDLSEYRNLPREEKVGQVQVVRPTEDEPPGLMMVPSKTQKLSASDY